jgi:uncharacterized protein YecE (DUF72 family)
MPPGGDHPVGEGRDRRRAVIRVGTAGWDYRDWEGIVYPANPGRGFDRLRFLSRFVDVIEINSSFYRPVAEQVSAMWVRRTADRASFRFTAKAHRSWTHDRQPDSDRLIEPTLRGLRPLLDAGRLGALLVQFPQSFHFTAAAADYLDRLVEPLGEWPIVVEVRHASWSSARAAEWFRERQIGWCVVDQPAIGRSTLGLLPRVTHRVAYLRMHGRNVANWFRPGAGPDLRYDYLYPPPQLDELGEVARRLSTTAEELFVVQNNHFRGKALVNALQMMRLLEGRNPQAPASLVAAYPVLRDQVEERPHGLF